MARASSPRNESGVHVVQNLDIVQLGLMDYSCLIRICGHTLVWRGQVCRTGPEAASLWVFRCSREIPYQPHGHITPYFPRSSCVFNSPAAATWVQCLQIGAPGLRNTWWLDGLRWIMNVLLSVPPRSRFGIPQKKRPNPKSFQGWDVSSAKFLDVSQMSLRTVPGISLRAVVSPLLGELTVIPVVGKLVHRNQGKSTGEDGERSIPQTQGPTSR